MSELSVDLPNVIFTLESKVFGLYYSPVNMLSLNFSHLLLVLYSKILANELGINGYDLNQFMPQLEDLTTY